jgi:TIR domain
MPVFISYSEKDTAPYTSLCFALESEKVDYWNPKGMKAGISLKDQLKDAINKCDVCIFIVTRSSIDSKWCLAETGAFWGAGKRIILYVANPDIGQQKIPPLFQGDLQTCDVREVIRQSKEALSEVIKAKRAVEIQPNQEAKLKRDEEADMQLYAQLCRAMDQVGGNSYTVEPGSPEHLWAERMVQKGLLKRLASGRFYSLPDGKAF